MVQVGTVISTFEGPSTRGFAFVVTDKSVRKGQFVVVQGDDGGIVGVVKELLRANRYFERAESVSEYEKRAPPGQGFLQSLPVASWEYIIADCSTLGSLVKEKGVMLGRAAFPPSPGSKVSVIDPVVLSDFLGFAPEGLHLGRLLQHDVAVKVSLSRLLQKHLAILGISGSGKSYFTSVLLEELLDRKPSTGRIAVVVFDVHGEYAGFADKHRNPSFAEKVTVVKGKDVRIAFHKLGVDALADILPDMSSTQARDLEKILRELRAKMKEGGKAYDLRDALGAVEASPLKENVKAPLLGWLGRLRRLKLFARADSPAVRDAVKPGRMLVFDLNSLTNQMQKQMILAYFARKLFKGRREGVIPPFVLFVEEAHSFAPEKVAKAGSQAKRVIETIAREGRKFGACLCLISQRPVQLSTTALSQANTYAIFKITNPYDLKHIQESCEALDSDVLGEITLLKTGEGIIIGEAVQHPVFVRVRGRKSVKSGRAETLEQIARDFEDSSQRITQAADVEQFI